MEEMIDFYEQKTKEYMEKYFEEKEKYELLKLRIENIVGNREDDISNLIKKILKNNKN